MARMAGTPQKRARKAMAAEPLPDPNAPARDTQAPARAPTGARAPAAPAVGPTVRQLLDSRQADALHDLGTALVMGCPVRIERVRPAWCAGWVEDTDIDVGDLGELYNYLQGEWGGSQYRVTALHVDGRPLMAVKLKVAGPPRQGGRLINRGRWEGATAGEDLPEGAPVAAAAAAGASPLADPLAFVQFMMTESRTSAAEARSSVQAVAERHSQDVQQLMGLIATRDATRDESNSLVGQIATLTEGVQAVEELRDTMQASQPTADAPEPERSGLINKAVETMVMDAMSKSVHQTDAPTPQTSRARVVRPNGAGRPPGIPDAATRQRSD